MNEIITLKSKKSTKRNARSLYGYQNMMLPRESYEALKRLKDQTGISMMELMNLAVERFLAQVKVEGVSPAHE